MPPPLWVKEWLSPPPHRMKKERCPPPPPLPHAIAMKARGCLRHYLDNGSSSSFQSTRTVVEYAHRERRRRDRCNATCQSEFVDSNIPPPHIAGDPELAYAWTRSNHRLRRGSDEMAKYGEH